MKGARLYPEWLRLDQSLSGIVAAAAVLRSRSAILDGEVIVQDERGASDFEELQAALFSRRSPLIFGASRPCTSTESTSAISH